MAGTSGCIPDHDVNFFGQLCKPARSPTTIPSPEEESKLDVDSQENNTPILPPPANTMPAPDRISELFQTNQKLIRGLSCGNCETYIATLKAIFAEVRQSRSKTGVKQLARQPHESEGYDEDEGQREDPYQVVMDDQDENEDRLRQGSENGPKVAEQFQICQAEHHPPPCHQPTQQGKREIEDSRLESRELVRPCKVCRCVGDVPMDQSETRQTEESHHHQVRVHCRCPDEEEECNGVQHQSKSQLRGQSHGKDSQPDEEEEDEFAFEDELVVEGGDMCAHM